MSKNHIQTFLEVTKSRARESNKGEKREFIFDLPFFLYHALRNISDYHLFLDIWKQNGLTKFSHINSTEYSSSV